MRAVTLLAMLLLAAPLLGQGVPAPPPPPPPSIESPMAGMQMDITIVSGSAVIDMIPDMVSFDIGVETDGKVLREIAAENNAKVTKIIAMLKARGVKAAEIRTSSFDVGALERDEQKVGFRISNQIGVTRNSATDVGELLAAAIELGANQVRGPEFSVRNEKSVQDRCIELAFADARGKAQKLAALSNRALGKVLAVTDGSSSPFEFRYHSPGVDGGVLGGFAIEPGVHPVECGVTVAFRLE